MRRLANGASPLVIDIREREEFEQGHVPGAIFIPRGFLELRIEQHAYDPDTPIVLYCAGGVRSALAARNLQEMGYSHVELLIGGFGGWKSAGLPVTVPRDHDGRAEGTLQPPHPAARRRRRGPKQAAGRQGAADRRGRAGLAGRTLPGRGRRRHARHRRLRRRRPEQPAAPNPAQRELDRQAEGRVRLRPACAISTRTSRSSRTASQSPAPTRCEIIQDYDIVLNGSDNFPTRYLVNDACHFLHKPLVDASIFMFEGQVTIYHPGAPEEGIEQGPCYRCLYPEPPPPGEVPSCAEAGVLGVLPGIVGSIQAAEAIKLILGKGEPLLGRLLMFDALEMSFRTLNIRRNPACPVCGDTPTITELIDYEQFCGMPARE